MVHNMLIIVFTFSFIYNVIAQDSAGDACVRNYDNRAGICRPSSSCLSAITLLQQAGIRPDICGYNREEPIICCVDPISRPAQLPTNNRRVSERKCDEYSRSVTHVVQALSLVAEPESISITVPKCDNTGVPLIVGGKKTKVGEFPHMVAIGWTEPGRTAWSCGGALVSDQFILTAAHCASSRGLIPDVIRLGEQNLRSDNDGAEPEDIPIAEIIRHPTYRYPSKYNDLALMRLSRRVRFNKFIRPACLWQKDNFDTNSSIATGWGKTDVAEEQSDDLLRVVINIIDNSQCAPLYYNEINRSLRNGIVETQMCAGVLEGRKDTCQGDSGGPLQIPSKSNKCIYNLIGVTSFGKGCGSANSPGVYTRISKYVDWIESVVWPGE